MAVSVEQFRGFYAQSPVAYSYGGAVNGTITSASGQLRCRLDNSSLTGAFVDAPTAKTIVWALGKADGIDDWAGAAGDEATLFVINNTASGGSYTIKAVYVSSSGFNIRLYEEATNKGTGSTLIPFASGGVGTNYWLLETNGTNLYLWYGSVPSLEVSSTSGNKISVTKTHGIYGASLGSTTKYHYTGQFLIVSGDTTADRPDPTTISSSDLPVASGAGHKQDFTTSSPAQTDANKYLNVDDWQSGAADDDTSTLTDPGAASTTYNQTFVTTNPTISNPQAVTIMHRFRINNNTKSNTFNALFGDGTTEVAGGATIVNAVNQAYTQGSWIRNTDVDGNAWAQTALNNFESGIQCVVSNQAASDIITAISSEVVGFTTGFAPNIQKIVQVKQAVNRSNTY